MKNKKEMLILSALLGLFGYFTVRNDPRTSTCLVYSIVHFLAMGLLFSGQVFYLYPRFMLRNKIGHFLLYSLLLFAGLYLLTSLCYALYFKALAVIASDIDFPVIQQMFDGPILSETSISLGMAMLLGWVYAVIRQWVKARRFQLLKRTAQFSSLTIFGVALIFGIKYYFDVNWKGNNTIHFIENQAYQSLEEMISQPQFENKVVYVDLWFTSCSPCIQEFQHLPEVKEELQGKPVEYLYLARETSMPHDRQ